MITRIEIDGFKSFKDFAVDLAPFTIIAGANAAGKSNLFDALRVITALTQGKDLKSSIFGRGSAKDLFTINNDGSRSDSMQFALEFKTDAPKGKGIRSFNYPNLRYEITISHQVNVDDELDESFLITEEKIVVISSQRKGNDQNLVNKNSAYLHVKNGRPIHDKLTSGMSHVDGDLSKTILSQTGYLNDIHIIAVKEEILSLHPFEQSREEETSRFSSSPVDFVNSLNKINKSDPMAMAWLRRVVQKVIPEVSEIKLYRDTFNKIELGIIDEVGRKFTYGSLSYGTRKMIELIGWVAAESNSFNLLIEDIENGIDPRRQDDLFELLYQITAFNLNDENGGRQIICTTHSPVFVGIARKKVPFDNNVKLLLATKVDHIFSRQGTPSSAKVTRMFALPADSEEFSKTTSFINHSIDDYLRQVDQNIASI